METSMSNTVSRIISDETLSRVIQIESAGNPNAKAKTSSATGLGQFIDSTWMAVVSGHRADLLKGRTRAEVLALRRDPSLAVELLARFTEDNAVALGKGYGDGDLYLAHFAGVGTARKILQAFPATPVSKIVAPAAIQANPSILRGKTCAEVREWAGRKMAAAGGRDWVGKWYRGKPAPVPQKAMSAGQGAAGAAAIVGTATVTTAVHQGLGAGAWLAIGAAVLVLIGAAYFGWRWWKRRQAASPVAPFEWTVGGIPAPAGPAPAVTPRGGSSGQPAGKIIRTRKPTAKRKAKRKAA
jgi:hypothetical protein